MQFALLAVLSLNLHRHHLTSAQRAALAVEVEPMLAKAAKERMRLSEGRGVVAEKGKEKVPDLNVGQARD